MKRFMISLAISAFFLTSLGSAWAEPVQWSQNGHWYEGIATGNTNWSDSYLLAQEKGGYLATITSAEENAFVFSLIDEEQFWATGPAGGRHGPWLGGYRLQDTHDPSRQWAWVTGEPFTYTHWGMSYGENSQPDSPLAQSSRLLYWWGPAPATGFDDGWDDANSQWSVPHAYVVEWSSNPVPEPSTIVGLLSLAFTAIAVGLWRKRRQ